VRKAVVLWCIHLLYVFFFFSSRRRHTRFSRDWSSDVCSSDLPGDRRPGSNIKEFHEETRRTCRRLRAGLPAPCQGSRHRQRSDQDRKSTRLNSSHVKISYAVFCLKKKKIQLIRRSSPPRRFG